MKYLLLTTTILIHLTATAQSPYLSLFVKMDSTRSEGKRYKIEMNICQPKKMTERGSWFSHDTSTIDFTSLKSTDIECGGYFDKGMPTLISGPEEKLPFNQFQFSGQVFVWEEIYIFRISDPFSRGSNPGMYLVMPMKYKSFFTHIALNDLEFQPGKVIFLTNYDASYITTPDETYLNIEQSLKSYKTVEVKNFPLKDLLEKK